MHQDADCLSRHHVDPPDENDDYSAASLCTISGLIHINEEQSHDPELRSIIENLNSASPHTSTTILLLRDDILYRRNVRPDGPELLLVVP